MNPVFKIAGLASAAVMATAVTASAAIIDFTDSSTGLVGAVGGGYVVTGSPEDPNNLEAAHVNCAAVSGLACETDGLGIKNDEISGLQYITISFGKVVKLAGAHFLDLYVSPYDATHLETALISKGAVPGAVVASKDATTPNKPANPGYEYLTPLSLKSDTFTFWVGAGNDDFGQRDYALAAVEISAVPLPAGGLLLVSALGGLVASRRRKA